MNFRIKLTKHLSIGPSGLRLLGKHGSIGNSGLLLHSSRGSVWLPSQSPSETDHKKAACLLCGRKRHLWRFEEGRIMCEPCAKRELNQILAKTEEINTQIVITPGCDLCKKLNRPLHPYKGGYMVCEPCLNNNFIFLNDKTAQIM